MSQSSPKIDLSGLPLATNKIYIPIYNKTERYLLIYGGAGSGKSRFIGQKMLYRVLTEPNHRFLVIRKVARTLRASVFQLFKDYITNWGMSEFFIINKSDLTISCKFNNSTILFFGLDDVEKLKSIEGITSIWIEEASEITQDDFIQLDLRLRGNTKYYKQIILSFNPISAEHWLKKHFIDNGVNDCYILKSTYLDNRFIDDKYKEVLENLKHSNPSKYKIYCLGDWGILKGLIYENYTLIDELPDSFDNQMYGIDFGFNNPSAVVYIRVKEDSIYIDEVLYQTHLINSQIIEYLNSNHPNLKNIIGYLDSAEPDRLEEFKKAGFMVKPAKKSILDGIDFVKKYNIFITKRSTNLLKEISGYVWEQDKDGNSLDIPVKLNDHILDALRYGVFTHLSKNVVKKLSWKVDFGL